MRARRFAVGVAIIAVLLTWGCARNNGPRPWADLAEINEQITKIKEARPAPLGGEVPSGELAQKGPRVKDLSVKEDGRNPKLQKLQQEKAAQKETGEGILLNFDNADIYEVIKVVAETLDLDYIIDPRVKGVVNIRTSKPIPQDELLSVFKKILNINGLDIIPEGDRHYIYPTANPSVQKVYCPNQVDKLGNSSKVVMQVVPLMYLSSAEALDLINPYLSDQGLTYSLADQNVLIVADFESMVSDIVQILSYLDVSPLTNLTMRLVRVENTSLFDLHDDLNEILTAMRVNKGEQGFASISVIPLERVNSLLLVSKSDYLMDNVQKWIEELDVVPSGGKDNIFFYNVRNTVASDLAELVNNILGEEGGATTTDRKTRGQRETAAAAPQEVTKPGETRQATTARRAEKKPLAAIQLAGGPTLIADDDRNLILVRAMPSDYRRIAKLLERLDSLPSQVLIEVMVAEVTLTDKLDFGVEWALKNSDLTINGSTYEQQIRSTNFANLADPKSLTGFTYGVLKNGDVRALLNALATDTHVSILSSPQILVLNNEPASINVGNQVPVPTSQITSAEAATSADQTTLATSIQYKDTGVILNVTPRINYNGIITLEVDQQVSNVGAIGVAGAPQIFNRQLKTKLAVKDGQSIMIGGLISKDSSISDTGVPFLKDIPLLGYAFKSHNQNTTKTELLVMITPYVIESEDVLQQYFRTFKEKMTGLRQELSERPKAKDQPLSPQPQVQPQPQTPVQPQTQVQPQPQTPVAQPPVQPQPEVLPWSPRQPPQLEAQPQPESVPQTQPESQGEAPPEPEPQPQPQAAPPQP